MHALSLITGVPKQNMSCDWERGRPLVVRVEGDHIRSPALLSPPPTLSPLIGGPEQQNMNCDWARGSGRRVLGWLGEVTQASPLPSVLRTRSPFTGVPEQQNMSCDWALGVAGGVSELEARPECGQAGSYFRRVKEVTPGGQGRRK